MDNFVEKVVFLYLHEYVFFCNYMRVELCRSERRKKLLIACGLIAVFLAYCFASPFVVSAIKKEKSKSLTIVVDAGHGGEDGGVKGAKTGVEEKNINLIVAKYLGEMLCACGFNVHRMAKKR